MFFDCLRLLNEMDTIPTKYHKIIYLEHELVVMENNGYVNVSLICQQYGKKFTYWKHSKQTIELMTFLACQLNIERHYLMVEIKKNDMEGVYIHPLLLPQLMSWVSVKVGLMISQLV